MIKDRGDRPGRLELLVLQVSWARGDCVVRLEPLETLEKQALAVQLVQWVHRDREEIQVPLALLDLLDLLD